MGLFKRPDSPYWWIYLEGLGRKQKTKFKIGATARQRRDSRALALNLYHREMLAVATRHHGLTPRPCGSRTLAQQIAWHREIITPQHAGAERETEILARLEVDLGHLALPEVTRAVVQEWMRERLEDVSASTVNREVDVLKAVLREAVPDYLPSSPLVGMKRLRSDGSPTRRLLTPKDERRLLARLELADRAIVVMGLDTLCRLSDILSLRRDDDRGATLFIRAPKNAVPYEVPVSSRLRRLLDKLPETGEYYFAHRRQAKTARDRRAGFRQALERACAKKPMIPFGRASGLTFHWMTRRTGATRMIQRGVDVRTVQEIGNWKQPGVLLRIYAESNADARKRAVELVGRFPTRSRRKAKRARKAPEND